MVFSAVMVSAFSIWSQLESLDLSNNNRLHLQFIWCCDAQWVMTHLSPALNSSVFTGELVDPDKQTSIFEYQQHVNTARNCSCAREFNDAGYFRQKTLKDFNILYKHQLTNATCVVQSCISVIYSRTVIWPEGVCVTAVTRWLICLVFCPHPCETASVEALLLLADNSRYFTEVSWMSI